MWSRVLFQGGGYSFGSLVELWVLRGFGEGGTEGGLRLYTDGLPRFLQSTNSQLLVLPQIKESTDVTQSPSQFNLGVMFLEAISSIMGLL